MARVPPELDRRRTSAPVRVHAWTPQLAYAVGLLATDGCLAGGKSVAFKSKDLELVELLLASLGKRNRITPVRTRIGGVAYLTQIGDVGFYRWLMTIGLSPRKSLTLGAIDVPDAFLLPLTRGLLDGDGSIMNKSARADTGRRSRLLLGVPEDEVREREPSSRRVAAGAAPIARWRERLHRMDPSSRRPARPLRPSIREAREHPTSAAPLCRPRRTAPATQVADLDRLPVPSPIGAVEFPHRPRWRKLADARV